MNNNTTNCYACNKLIRASLLHDNEKRYCVECKQYRDNSPRITFIGEDISEEINNINIDNEINGLGSSISFEATIKELEALYIPNLNKRTLSEEIVANNLKLEWTNPIAVQRANEFALNGMKPTVINKERGGFAIWDNVPGWVRIEIKDRPVLHFDPAPHIDVMFATAKVNVPVDKAIDLKYISQTLTHNELTNEVTAGCHFLGASIATLALVKMYVDGKYTKERAQAEYGRTIKRLSKELKDFEAFMISKGEFYSYSGDYLKETLIWERYITGTNHNVLK